MTRYVASVREVRHANQFVGLPSSLSSGAEPSELMPTAEMLVIEGDPGNYTLFRYTMAGEFSGDTWHASLDDAFHQANYEFGSLDSDWMVVPDDAADPIAYSRQSGGGGYSK